MTLLDQHVHDADSSTSSSHGHSQLGKISRTTEKVGQAAVAAHRGLGRTGKAQLSVEHRLLPEGTPHNMQGSGPYTGPGYPQVEARGGPASASAPALTPEEAITEKVCSWFAWLVEGARLCSALQSYGIKEWSDLCLFLAQPLMGKLYLLC